MKFAHIAGLAALAAVAGCAETTTTSTAPAAESGGSSAESSCIAAVSKQTGVSDVSLLTQNTYAGGTLVSVTVAGAEAPWACQVGSDGTVDNVYYTAEG